MTEHLNMADFIAARSDQLNADDLLDGPITITITKVSGTGSSDQPIAVHYEGGEGRPLKPCKTVRRLMVAAWGPEAKSYVGRRMTLYRDPTVSFGGMIVGGIRVSHMSHLDEKKTLALQVTKGRKAPFTILPLKDAPAAERPSDFSGQLAELKALAKPGNMDALGAKWQEIGQEARKALAAELPALKAACETPGDDALAPTLANIANAVSIREVDAIDKDTEADRAFLTEEQAARLDEALATKRAELREKEPAQ